MSTEIPEFPTLRDKKAAKTLHDFVAHLKEKERKELTDKQTTALVKIAEALIPSIQQSRGRAK